MSALRKALGLAPLRVRKGSTGNRYKRHQGPQECARRVRQGLAGYDYREIHARCRPPEVERMIAEIEGDDSITVPVMQQGQYTTAA